ncbi:cytochrome P450 [Streptomyces sp. NPDC048057]|uniref:cytochrome P450 family protein n=1 Tax=Streptomyces sp. NPDC048057 TaxID=3155628 RepID=UPI0033EA5088
MDPQRPLVLDPTAADRRGEDAALRQRGPLTRVDVLGEKVWAVSDRALLKRLLMDGRISKDAVRHWPRYPHETQDWPLNLWVGVRNMFTAYGDDHRRLRRLISPAFAGRRIAALAPRIEAIAADLLDGLAAVPAGSVVDLRERFAAPLPIRVISHLLGLPEDRATGFRSRVDGVFDSTITGAEAEANARAFRATLAELIDEKRESPGDDLTTRLIDARDTEGDGTGLSDDELVDSLMLMVSAGYETTINLIDHALVALLTHPEQRSALLTGAVSYDDVVEETLRWQAPVPFLPMRFATVDIELPEGVTIRAGEAVLAAYSAANTHPDVYGPDADRFDPARSDRSHLTFGHGVHVCLGAALARLEGVIALRAVLDRFPHLALAVAADELRPMPSFLSNGHRSVPTVLTPAPGA